MSEFFGPSSARVEYAAATIEQLPSMIDQAGAALRDSLGPLSAEQLLKLNSTLVMAHMCPDILMKDKTLRDLVMSAAIHGVLAAWASAQEHKKQEAEHG